MSTAFQRSAFQDNAFQIDEIESEALLGGKGDNARRIVKPTGLPFTRQEPTPPAGRKTPDERTEDSRRIEAEVAAEVAREFAAENLLLATPRPIAQMTPQQVSAEIGILLRRRMRQTDEELMLLMLAAAAI